MRVVSTFSGVGGFDLAFQRAGFEIAAQVEVDKHCQRVLRRHFPGVELFGDITDVSSKDLGPADILCGGFPCQDLSVAGRRAGLAGKRSGLFYEFARLAEELLPSWIILENVPGLLSSRGGRDMGAILGTLAELGYGFAYRVLDAQYFGVPQRRRRVFIVGCLGDPAHSAKVLFESESLSGNPPSRREAEQAIASGAACCVRTGGDYHNPTITVDDRAFLAASPMSDRQMAVFQPSAHYLTFGQEVAGPLGSHRQGGYRNDLDNNGAFVGSYWDGGDVSDTLDVSMLSKGQMMPERRRFPAVLTFNWQTGGSKPRYGFDTQGGDALSATQTPAVLEPEPRVRRLTPRECERLQGFPDDWTLLGDDGKQISDTQRYRMMGNAVAVPVVEWLAHRIAGVS